MLPNWLYGKSKSKLAGILGGGGTPADYDQVKAQVNQNTDIITNKILLTRQSSVRVTADGTKTYATLLVEAITALRSVIGSLASNERLKPIRITIYGLFVIPIAYEIFFDKTNTSISINFIGNIVSVNVYQTVQIQANNTGNIYVYRSDNGNITDRGSEVPASGNFIEITYEIYTFT